MANLTVGDHLLVTIQGSANAQRILFNMWYRVDSAGVPLSPPPDAIAWQLTLAATAFGPGGDNVAVTQAYIDALGSDYVPEQVRVQRINPERSVYMSAPLGVLVPNPLGASEVLGITAPLLMRTAMPGPSGHCTKHIGPVPQAGFDGGAFTDAYKLRLVTLGDAMMEAFTTTDGDYTLALGPGLPNPFDGGMNYWWEYVLPDRQGTQRTRLLRVGE